MKQQRDTQYKPKVVAILGPNASGKSGIAIKLAKKFDGEVISADSRQVYRGMDIGSGKVEGKTVPGTDPVEYISEGVVHYMIDIVDPGEVYSAGRYKKDAEKVLEHIVAKGKLPVICGGTGFWARSLIFDTKLPEVEPDWELRKELEKKTHEELYEMLKSLDPKRAKTIDRHNPVRLIRAVEIAKKLGFVPEKNEELNPKYEFLQIGIKWPRDELSKRIEKRVHARFEQGILEEVRKLHENGLSWERLESFGLDYKRVAEHLRGKLINNEFLKRWYLDDKQYAKRQMTWFRKNPHIIWLNSYEDIEANVSNFLSEKA